MRVLISIDGKLYAYKVTGAHYGQCEGKLRINITNDYFVTVPVNESTANDLIRELFTRGKLDLTGYSGVEIQ